MTPLNQAPNGLNQVPNGYRTPPERIFAIPYSNRGLDPTDLDYQARLEERMQSVYEDLQRESLLQRTRHNRTNPNPVTIEPIHITVMPQETNPTPVTITVMPKENNQN